MSQMAFLARSTARVRRMPLLKVGLPSVAHFSLVSVAPSASDGAFKRSVACSAALVGVGAMTVANCREAHCEELKKEVRLIVQVL